MGFTKLDEGILRSSIMAEDAETFKVWITFLASCGPDGIARVSAVFLSSVCRLPIEIIHKAIIKLEAPDPESRSEAEEGRRIIRIDGGWFIVNFEKYRSFNYSLKDEAVRKREYRERIKKGTLGDKKDSVPFVPGHSASASASASASEEEVQEREDKFNEFWKAYPQAGRHAKKESRIKFGALVKRDELVEFIKGFHGYLDFLKHEKLNKGFDQTPMYAKTFLGDRWREFIGFEFKSG